MRNRVFSLRTCKETARGFAAITLWQTAIDRRLAAPGARLSRHQLQDGMRVRRQSPQPQEFRRRWDLPGCAWSNVSADAVVPATIRHVGRPHGHELRCEIRSSMSEYIFIFIGN